MHKVTCWYIEDASLYETTKEWKGPAYVFMLDYVNYKREEKTLAQFISQKTIEIVGSYFFSHIRNMIIKESGKITVTEEEIREAFANTKPATEYNKE